MHQLWPGAKQITGTPRWSQSNGGIEVHNRTMEAKVNSWMLEMNSNSWSIGCYFVAWKTNTQIVRSIGNKSPHELLTGQKPNQGLSTLPIHPELLSEMQTEGHLHSILNSPADIPIEEARVNMNGVAEKVKNLEGTSNDKTEATNDEADSSDESCIWDDSIIGITNTLKERQMNSNSDYSSISENEIKLMEKWHDFAENISDSDALVLKPSDALLRNISHQLPSKESLNATSAKPSVTDNEAASTSFASNAHGHSSAQVKNMRNEENIASWLFLSRKKCAKQDLHSASAGDSFAILESNDPINNEGANLLRRIVAKIEESKDEHASKWQMMDEHGKCVIANIVCDKDHGLLAEWDMCYCRPNTKHIEDAECELHQSNQPPSFPDLPINDNSNNNQRNTADVSNNATDNENEEDALDEVSPRRALLRTEANKHKQKQAEGMIRRAHMKGGSVNVGDVVQITISRVDLAKTDCKNLTLMVVEERTFRKNPPMHRLANKIFQM